MFAVPAELFGLSLDLPLVLRIVGLVVLTLVLRIRVRRLRREQAVRLRHTPDQTFLARREGQLPGAIEVLASAGQAGQPVQSADAIVLRTTPGVRLVGLVLGVTLLWLLFGPTRGVYVPDGWPTWAMAAVVALAIVGTISFEARVDADRLVLVHYLHWRREYRWRDLVALRDDGGYAWRLDFASGRARVPKHLVGMPGFLSLVAEHLDRNAARNARTARG